MVYASVAMLNIIREQDPLKQGLKPKLYVISPLVPENS